MDTLRQDLRFALRGLAKAPGFAATVVAVMALGIGANIAIFSVVDAVLFRPLPVPRPAEMVELYSVEDGVPVPSSYPDFLDLRARRELFAGTAAWKPALASFGEGSGARVLYGEEVSADYFRVLGLPPERGRGFLPEEDRPGAPLSIVVSHAFWRRELGGDPALAGRTVVINGRKVPVVGVADRRFRGSFPGLAADYWLSIRAMRQLMPSEGDSTAERGVRSFFVKARLRPGVGLPRVQAGLDVLARRLAAAYPASNVREGRGMGLTALPSSAVRIHPKVDRTLAGVAALLMAVPGLVLLVACSNVAGLLLARASARGREIAVRLALGAGRRRLVRQLLTESALLSLAGGAAGLLLAWGAVEALLAFQPPLPIPLALDLQIGSRVLLYTLAVSLATGLLFGLAPALQLTRPDLAPALKAEGGGQGLSRRSRLRGVLVVAQVAVSLVLLVAAGLFVRSLGRAQAIDPGFESRDALLLTPGLIFTGAGEAESREIYRRLGERLAALPGVEAVALASRIPLGPNVEVLSFHQEGTEPAAGQEPPEVDFATVDAAYFRALDVPILAGRGFAAADRPGAPRVAVVSEAAARRFWPGGEALGRRFRLGAAGSEPWTVVGVARDTRVRTLGEAPRPYVYLPAAQREGRLLTVVVRTAGAPASLVPAVRRAVEETAPGMPVMELKTMEQHLALMLFPPRAGAAVLALCGALALLLAATGLYGLVAFTAARRTREIGIRMALGARRGNVVALVVRQGMVLVGMGLALGIALAAVATRPLAAYLYGVDPGDPAVFAALAGALLAVAVAASYLPAARAARTEPTVALRSE